MTEDIAALALRLVNFIGWTTFAVLVLVVDRPVPRTARQIIALTLIAGMAVFAIGGLVPFGFSRDTARAISNIFCGFALTGVLVTLLANRPHRLPRDGDVDATLAKEGKSLHRVGVQINGRTAPAAAEISQHDANTATAGADEDTPVSPI